MESKKGSVREETNAVSGTTVMSVQNEHQKPLHPLCTTNKRKKCVEKRDPQRSKSTWEVQSTAVQRLLALKYLVTIGILPKVSFISRNRVVNSAISARFRTGRLRNNQIKKPKKGGGKIAVFTLKDVRQLGCVFQDTAARICIDFTEGPKNLGTNSTSTIHKSHAASRRHLRKQRTIRPAKYNSTILISAVPML